MQNVVIDHFLFFTINRGKKANYIQSSEEYILSLTRYKKDASNFNSNVIRSYVLYYSQEIISLYMRRDTHMK